MGSDRYTKCVLSIIAVALVALVIQGLMPKAEAQLGSGCGEPRVPCYVATSPDRALQVTGINGNPMKVNVVP
jgi:hypothetical protein